MKKILQSIDQKEWRFVIFIIGLLLLITAAPYIIGLLKTPDGQFLTGINFLTPGDISVYYSYIEQARSGKWLFKDLYTHEAQSPHLFSPIWLLGGVIASLFSLSNALTYLLLKLLLIPVLIIAIYLLIAHLNEHKKIRKISLIVICFSSGISAYFSFWFNKIFFQSAGYYHLPMDLWTPESNTFLTLFHNPLICFSLIFLVLTFIFFLVSLEENKLKYAFYAGLTCLILIVAHPFMALVVFGVMFVYLFLRCILDKQIIRIGLRVLFIIFLTTAPALIYYMYLLLFNPIFKIKSSQNICLTPAFWMIGFSYGFLLVLFLIGLFRNRQNRNNRYLFILTWFFVQFAFLWSPIIFQRRLSEGLHLPLAYLATLSLWCLYEKIKNYKYQPVGWIIDNKIILIFLFIIFLGISNLAIWGQSIFNYFTKDRFYLYQTSTTAGLMDWLKKNTERQSIILAEMNLSNLIPGFTGRTVYFGHGVETVNFREKEEKANQFYQNNDLPAQLSLLADESIDYVIFQGKQNREIKEINYHVVYTNQDYVVYHFID